MTATAADSNSHSHHGAGLEEALGHAAGSMNEAMVFPIPDAEKGRGADGSTVNGDQRHANDSSDETALEDQPDGKSISSAPDGGLQAWLVVLGAWCSSFVSYGWINSKPSTTPNANNTA